MAQTSTAAESYAYLERLNTLLNNLLQRLHLHLLWYNYLIIKKDLSIRPFFIMKQLTN